MKIKIPNKEIILLAAAIIAIAVCIAMQCISLIGIRQISKEDNIACEATISTEIVANKALYRLCECGGKVGIYDAETNIIIDIIDIFVSTLPKNDRIALKSGIEIYSFKELSEIIEDFST